MVRIPTLAFLLVLLAGFVPAQDFRATITGQVLDPMQAAVPGATVRAIQQSTNQVTEAKSNAEGYYTLPYLQPSTYDVEVTADGFNKLRRSGITLMVAEKLDLPLRLEIGKVSEQVTVTGEVESVQTADASGGLNFDSVMTSEYPLNGRQVYMLMDLTPGVLFTQEQFGVTGFSGTRGWDVNGSYVMNGGVQGTNSFTLNGAPISLTGSWQLSPNVEAIQEFKVTTNQYDAQYGRTGGGSVNTTLKSGSNRWHGSVFEFHRNSILDSNYTQNNRVGAPRGKHITHQWGGTLGGALRKDRDFVFFSFEGFRERVPFPVVSNTPPMDMRDGQHFAGYGINIYDPLTAHECVAAVDLTSGSCSSPYIRNPFPGNLLPKSRMSPVGQKILALYPAPNMSGLTQNFVASNNVGKYRYDQPMARYDKVINERDRLFAIFTFQHGHEFRNQNGFPPPISAGNIWTQRRNLNLIADWTRIVSPTAILDVRLSFGRFTSYFPDGLVDSGFSVKDLGMTSMPHAPTSTRDFPPRITLDQFTNIFGSGSNMFTWNSDNQWNLVPTLTFSRGTRTIKVGVDLVYAMRATGSIGRANGQFAFTREYTRRYPLRSGNTYDGWGVADLLMGHSASGFIDYNDTFFRTWPYMGYFVQNDWKLRRNLTLNLGLRYDVQFPFVERYNRVNNGFDFNAMNPMSDAVLAQWAQLKARYDATNPRFPYPPAPAVLLGGKTFVQPGADRRTYNTDWTNFQPRIGLAWLFAPRTVLRTGFGVYHRTATQWNYADGFSQQTQYIDTADGGITPMAGLSGPYSLENPFPNGIIPPSGRELGLLTNLGRGVSFDGRQRLIPRTFQYSFGLQRRIWSVLLDASYVGSQTIHDSMNMEMNYYAYDAWLQGQQVPNYLDRTVNNPFYGILPVTSTLGAATTIAARELYRPFPLFQGITMNTNPWGKYRYDALQLRTEKRFFGNRSKSGALTIIFSYTFSKNFQTTTRRNSWNLSEPPTHQLVSYDKPQNIAFSGVWDLPVGRGRKFYPKPGKAMDRMASGWTVNWIYRYVSGNPVTWMDTQFSCGSYLVENQTRDRWFNNDTTCYRSRPSYTLRTVPNRFPWLRQMDAPSLNLAASKTFRLNERFNFNLRAEAFNLRNKPLFGAPETGYQNVRFGQLPLDQRNFPRLVQISGKILF